MALVVGDWAEDVMGKAYQLEFDADRATSGRTTLVVHSRVDACPHEIHSFAVDVAGASTCCPFALVFCSVRWL